MLKCKVNIQEAKFVDLNNLSATELYGHSSIRTIDGDNLQGYLDGFKRNTKSDFVCTQQKGDFVYSYYKNEKRNFIVIVETIDSI